MLPGAARSYRILQSDKSATTGNPLVILIAGREMQEEEEKMWGSRWRQCSHGDIISPDDRPAFGWSADARKGAFLVLRGCLPKVDITGSGVIHALCLDDAICVLPSIIMYKYSTGFGRYLLNGSTSCIQIWYGDASSWTGVSAPTHPPKKRKESGGCYHQCQGHSDGLLMLSRCDCFYYSTSYIF